MRSKYVGRLSASGGFSPDIVFQLAAGNGRPTVGGQEWPPYFLRTRKKYLGRALLAVPAPRTELAVHHHQPEIGAQHVLIGYLRLVAAEPDAVQPSAWS